MESPTESTILFIGLHAGEIKPIISKLRSPEPNTLAKITSISWDVVESSSDIVVSKALDSNNEATAGAQIRLFREAVSILKAAYAQMDQETKLNSTLFGALKVLQESGSRYRKPEIVEQVKIGLQILLADKEEHCTLAKMLKLPSRLNSVPARRRHKKRDKRPVLEALIPSMCISNPHLSTPCVQPETPDSEEWRNYVELLQQEATPTLTGASLLGETLSQEGSPETSRTAWMHAISSPFFPSFSGDES